jgi:hypothetical protein
MDFLINESQLRVILKEQDESKMSNYMKTLYSFTYNLVNKVIKKIHSFLNQMYFKPYFLKKFLKVNFENKNFYRVPFLWIR